MAALFLPFGYPGYPQKQLAEHIAKSEAWLKDIGVDLVAAPNVIVLDDCPAYAGAVIKFDNKTVEDFQQEIMSQHYAVVPGKHGDAVRDFCKLMNIRVF